MSLMTCVICKTSHPAIQMEMDSAISYTGRCDNCARKKLRRAPVEEPLSKYVCVRKTCMNPAKRSAICDECRVAKSEDFSAAAVAPPRFCEMCAGRIHPAAFTQVRCKDCRSIKDDTPKPIVVQPIQTGVRKYSDVYFCFACREVRDCVTEPFFGGYCP